ncbi:Uncharacterised protein [Candidatus Bilamarchaeum dharawalense]|uniref:Uncharacterized protein n=1 Tax=Candidatus Bilamarchaeum dharawalense TaxID=2885759 RepID=A0A5E4LT30_9ARCH|nr:Uncharacterised protein [Candidatus Bilamarchaeum dharawalense]
MQTTTSYTAREKIGPFIRGVFGGDGPFVEIAIKGLKKGVPEPLGMVYAERVGNHAPIDAIGNLLKKGLPADMQEVLASALKRRYENGPDYYGEVLAMSFTSIPGLSVPSNRISRETAELGMRFRRERIVELAGEALQTVTATAAREALSAILTAHHAQS